MLLFVPSSLSSSNRRHGPSKLGTIWKSRWTWSNEFWDRIAFLDRGQTKFYLGTGIVHSCIHGSAPYHRWHLVVPVHSIFWRQGFIFITSNVEKYDECI